jgi:hypothetical protein
MADVNEASVGDEEEDYMSMAIVEPDKPKMKETYTQRRKRKEREAEEKGRHKSKKELEAEAAAVREAALAKEISSESKGAKMMAKLGFKQGDALGAARNPNARREPVELQTKDDRGGIGLDTEKKRKFREEVEGEAKRVKAEEGEYRERVAKEREDRRVEGQIGGAMRIAERMDAEGADKPVHTKGDDVSIVGIDVAQKPLKATNVLWRSLARDRLEKERSRRMRYDLQQSLSRNAQYDDPEEDDQDRIAFGKEEELLDEEDPELEEFLQLEPAERLHRLVLYLRETYHYCFWCKYRYADAQMDGCPGMTEEDHD